MTEKEYIEREALISILKHSGLYHGETYIRKDGVINLIENRPAADVVEVRCGEWVSELVTRCDWRGKKQQYYQPNSCNLCHEAVAVRTNYCPNCGAKMDGKGE